MIQIIISPAKQMSSGHDGFETRGVPPFPDKTREVVRALGDIERDRGAQGLKELWHVSDKLLAENVERLHGLMRAIGTQRADGSMAPGASAPALFSYIGIQYRSIAPDVLDGASLEWLQERLWILSGLYGCARPLDAVVPYRLEMAAKLPVGTAHDLYAFWGDLIARTICPNDEPTVVVNLASVEYARAVLP
ncbi:MAG: YaaA family protein, partial [Collinsella sp.]|nr:YaaA family protein [Collinsella sp.]